MAWTRVFREVFRAGVLQAVGSQVGGRVLADLAPKGTPLPYITITISTATTPNQMAVLEGRITFNVQVVVDGSVSHGGDAERIHDLIFDFMQTYEPVFPSPWSFFRLEHLSTYAGVITSDTQRLPYTGGLYLLEADRQ